MAGLRKSMHGLPIRFLGLTRETLRRLQAAGILFLEELWRLPRPDLARRFGPALVRKLDQILGMHPDPRQVDTAPVRFERYFELDADTVETGFILRAARFLLEQFAGFLAAGNAVAGDILILLEHMDKPATRIDVGTRLPMRNADQWERLLGEYISRRELRAPVVSIRLSGSVSRDTAPVSGDLFQFPDTTRDWACVLDELEARLGKKHLWMPGVAADHRPEYAWQPSPPGHGSIVAPGLAGRPLWLLRTPRHLGHRDDHVSGPRPMDIVDGPERIESGWWDDNEYCRDYYTAVCPQGRRLWIFRDLKQKSDWYLHGLFG
jgi:protein ImuB